MSKNNYMGKIDEDYSGTTIPNYDTPPEEYCELCGDQSNDLKKARFANEDNFTEELWICSGCYNDYKNTIDE